MPAARGFRTYEKHRQNCARVPLRNPGLPPNQPPAILPKRREGVFGRENVE
jgi:hypothetical protein